MFGKQPFGSTTGTGFNTTTTFGQQPTFGANTSATGFGSTTGNVFSTPQSNPFQSTTASVFGSAPSNVSFGNASTFGTTTTAQPSFGGSSFFGNTSAQSSLFSQNKPTTSINQPSSFSSFGQPSLFNSPASTQSVFGANQSTNIGFSSAFQQQQQQQQLQNSNGSVIKFNPITGSDNVMRNGSSVAINTRNNCICAMKEYENKSMEELRYEDYLANRKGPSIANTNLFGTTSNVFDNKNLFSTQNTNTNTNANVGFNTNTSNFFGAPKQVSFGSVETTNAPTFNNSQLFNTTQLKPFGTTDTQQNSTLFNNQNRSFGLTTTAAIPLGSSTAPTTINSMTGFGANQFNQPNTSFGQNSLFSQQNKTFPTLFPQSTSNPNPLSTSFTFNNQPTNNTGLNLSTGPLQQKPSLFAPTGLFSSTNQTNNSLNTFNSGGSLFTQQPSTLTNQFGNQSTFTLPTNQITDLNKDPLLMRMKFGPFGLEGFDLNTKVTEKSSNVQDQFILRDILNERQKKINHTLPKSTMKSLNVMKKIFFGDVKQSNHEVSACQYEEKKNKRALKIKIEIPDMDLYKYDLLKNLTPKKDAKLDVNHVDSNKQQNVAPQKNNYHLKGNIILNREDYYTIPPLNEIESYDEKKGTCFVSNLTIGRYNYGNIYFPGLIDIANMNLDEIVEINEDGVRLYPDNENKPPENQGLNRKALVTLDNIWPSDPETKRAIQGEDSALQFAFINELKERCQKMSVDFVEYRCDCGSWVYRTNHF